MEEQEKKTTTEEFEVKSADLGERIKSLLKEGNIRKIVIKNSLGKKYIEIPVNVGIVTTVVAFPWVVLGALIVLFTRFRVEIIRDVEEI